MQAISRQSRGGFRSGGVGVGGASLSEKCELQFRNRSDLSARTVPLGTQKVCGSPSNIGKKGSDNVLLITVLSGCLYALLLVKDSEHLCLLYVQACVCLR